ncbi:exodeoxyribonuclease V subunit alpha [Aliidiomarina celeris]|uniref:exodeoxyribonuclease V subunit alpha n=1 Tax=Aliidiomarina celeris TaxID=2249428 RepID=UPI000DEB735D|nr:exodeoxyribonuclease V subunit alpha [Aliidiomarina celeris]
MSSALFSANTLVRQLHEMGVSRAIDSHFATLLMRTGCAEILALLGALVSHQVGRGHTCLSLTQLLDNPQSSLGLEPEHADLAAQIAQALASKQHVVAALEQSAAVMVLGHGDETADTLQPLVWDPKRELLYLRRYWQHEQRIRNWLVARTEQAQTTVAPETLREVITRLFDESDAEIAWQRVACANAAKQNFSVITGGPGTGKTYTVVRVLATLLAFDQGLRIALAAPTGKAAARMDESVNNALAEQHADLERVKQNLQRKASTLHRLLGSQRNSRYFRHNQNMPLPYDVVVVDEASMIDTEMFDALLDATGPNTKLILLGDKDQLAPVEAGSILATLCRNADQRHYSAAHARWLAEASGEPLPEGAGAVGLADHIVMLEGSQRFKGGIADIAHAVNACNVEAANAALQKVKHIVPPMRGADVASIHSDAVAREFWRGLARGFEPYVALCNAGPVASDDLTEDAVNAWAAQVLAGYADYQLLTALRSGPWGQQQVNQTMELIFRAGTGVWYHGRPVMVSSNDYSLNLNNGDIGIVLKHPIDQKLRVAFAAPVSALNPHGVRWVLPSRLTSVETVYAMTVHKSQGSEFRHAVLILPDRPTPVLTKELIYTGVTRAKEELSLVIPNLKVWQQGITTRIERLGGLAP